jgi:hypothetical protein
LRELILKVARVILELCQLECQPTSSLLLRESMPLLELQIGARILELVFQHSHIVLQLRDTVEPSMRDTLDALELVLKILNRHGAVFHVHGLKNGDCFVEIVVVVAHVNRLSDIEDIAKEIVREEGQADGHERD